MSNIQGEKNRKRGKMYLLKYDNGVHCLGMVLGRVQQNQVFIIRQTNHSFETELCITQFSGLPEHKIKTGRKKNAM